jgi:hypothetical protein
MIAPARGCGLTPTSMMISSSACVDSRMCVMRLCADGSICEIANSRRNEGRG